MDKTKKALKVLVNPDYRFIIMANQGLLRRLPDKYYSKRWFKIKMGYKLNLCNPQTFNEKLQWLKLYDHKDEYTKLVDKYEAKIYVAEVIGEKYIVKNFGVWNSFDEIDFSMLPNQFVLKCTHDSGGLAICRDKINFDIDAAKNKISNSLKRNYYYGCREWPYKNVKPRIIAEQYLEQEDGSALTDYKFFCFNGRPKFLYISKGLEYHPTAQIGFYDMNGNEMPFYRNDYKPFHDAKMPDNFTEMKIVAEKLATNVKCPFVRIDLYSINGFIYFSEITFSPCSGMIPFEPKSADRELGKLLKLPIEG